MARGSTNQPPASNMMELQWDDELSVVAQRLADQCVFSHDCADCRQVQRFRVGQNLYQSFNNRPGDLSTEWTKAVESWYGEISLFPPTEASVTNYQFSPDTGHYTQMMWSSTTRLGCGMAEFTRGRFLTRLLVCNYGEAGNIIGAPMYSLGPSCTFCPPATSCSDTYPGLCSEQSNNQPPSPTTISTKVRPIAPIVSTPGSVAATPSPVPVIAPPTSRPVILVPTQQSPAQTCDGDNSFFCLLTRPRPMLDGVTKTVMNTADHMMHMGQMVVSGVVSLPNFFFSSLLGKR